LFHFRHGSPLRCGIGFRTAFPFGCSFSLVIAFAFNTLEDFGLLLCVP
jgi:hypothetical protein